MVGMDLFGHRDKYTSGTKVITGYYYEQDVGNPLQDKANSMFDETILIVEGALQVHYHYHYH